MTDTQGKLIDEPEPPPPEQPPAEPEPAVETAPHKPRLVDRVRSRRGRARASGSPRPAPAERPPRKERRKVGRRVALDVDISDVWAFAGRRLETTPHYPTGRMLQYQAPAAGVIVDKAIAGTLVDRAVFQPLARNRSKYEDLAFLLLGPGLTFTLTNTLTRMQLAADEGDKDTYDELNARLAMQREMFTWALQMMLPRLAAGKKIAEEKKAKRDAEIAEAFPDLGADDPAEVLANMMFAPPNFQEATNASTEEDRPDPRANSAAAG